MRERFGFPGNEVLSPGRAAHFRIPSGRHGNHVLRGESGYAYTDVYLKTRVVFRGNFKREYLCKDLCMECIKIYAKRVYLCYNI
jgi:hypothetical protein